VTVLLRSIIDRNLKILSCSTSSPIA